MIQGKKIKFGGEIETIDKLNLKIANIFKYLTTKWDINAALQDISPSKYHEFDRELDELVYMNPFNILESFDFSDFNKIYNNSLESFLFNESSKEKNGVPKLWG